MDETSAARDELDRSGRALREQLVVLVQDLTIRVQLRRLALGEPQVADLCDLPGYRYSLEYQGNRRPAVSAAETASRAVALLGAAGWDVATSQEEDDGWLWTVIVARRDGSGIRVMTSDDTLAVVFRGQTAVLALHVPQAAEDPVPDRVPVPVRTPEPEPRPEREPVRTSETLTPGYVLCYECDGLGWCPGCHGRGWRPRQPEGRRRCGECGATKVCAICRGGGQLSVYDLSPYQRGYYPELDQS